jgi:GMP reductase
MRISHDVKLDFKDVLIIPQRSTLESRSQVNLIRTIKKMKWSSHEYSGVPIMASNMDTIGTFEMAVELSKFNITTVIHKYYTLDEWRLFVNNHPECIPFVAPSMGITDDFCILDNIPELHMICLDVANGYTDAFVNFVKKVRCRFKKHTIIAGNVVTPEMTEELIMAGADIVKIGIGPGSVCTTRLKTGVGYPQLSAINECASVAHDIDGLVIADGGCLSSGDMAKAFGAGADFVMIGGLLSGHTECSGIVIKKDESLFKEFYGMSSQKAMEKHSGGVSSYKTSEGKYTLVPYKGSVSHTCLGILGGLRSTCTYVGAMSIEELPDKTSFVRI